MKAIVLLYHSHNISSAEYAGNDHVALAADLHLAHSMGARFVSLHEIARRIEERSVDGDGELLVGISFDDGPVFDMHDFEHPQFGPQRGFLNILRDFQDLHGAAAQPGLHATSFVIASPEARKAMETSPACGYEYLSDWLDDAWWREAERSGLVEIGNHTWDHVHEAPPVIVTARQSRGDFSLVDNYPDADSEIRRGAEYIAGITGKRCRLFAFPFGHSNRFLVDEYLPAHRSEHGMEAAFGASGGVITNETSVWNIPRWICGHHWRSPQELERLLSS